MRLFTFDHNHNPGRSHGWTVQAEAIRMADQGASGLAGIILRDGFSPLPAQAVPFIRNEEGITMAEICAAIVEGLASRKNEAGGVRSILNGTDLELFRRRLEDIASRKAYGIVIDGRRRCIATLMAYGCGRDDAEVQGVELTPEQAADAEAAFKLNCMQELASRLDPWAKVEAGERVLSNAPTTAEVDLMKVLGVKRGDGQLIHRAASAIRKHRLVPDRAARCPSKEEWKDILACETSEAAATMLATIQTSTRAKALGVDQVAKVLTDAPEGLKLDARGLGKSLSDRASFDAFIAAALKG